MKRIEAEVRGTASARPTMGGGYSGNVRLEGGPLSAMAMTSSEPTAGRPTMGGARVGAGPLGYSHIQPVGAPKPVRQVDVTIPFDADAYFGGSVASTPAGREYGLNVGKGDFNAYGTYNPSRRDLNAGFQFERRFNHGGPVHMEEGGPFEAPPLTIFRKSPPKEAPVGDVEKRGAVDNVPAPEAYSRKFSETVREIPQGVIDYFKAKSEQPDPSQRIADDIKFAGSAIAGIPSSIAGYFAKKSEESDPSQKIAEDIQNLGGAFKQAFMENPVGMALDIMNLPGAVTSLRDASDAKKEYEEAIAEGDEKKAASAKNRYAMALPGIIPVVGGAIKVASKGSKLADVAQEASAASKVAEDAEHVMNVERSERRTVQPSSIKLLDTEKEVVNSFDDPIKQGMVASTIRNTKARYPVSDGWQPFEAVGAEFDDKGNVVIKWKEQTYGYNKGEVTSTKPVLDESYVPQQKLDKEGKPVFDKNGEPVMEKQPALKQPKLDAEGNPVLDAEGKPVMTNKNVTQEITDVRALRPGTPQYDKLVSKAVKNAEKDILDVVRRANNGDEAARVILRQLGWYREFMKKGFDERGGAYPAFSDLLGATSPNTAVDQNYRYSVEAQKRFARGDFDPQVQAAADYKANGKSLTDFPEENLIRRNDAFDEKTGQFKQYGMNSRNAQMAMADEWRAKEQNQAPKARNFSGNLGGATDEATIDVWAARFLNRMVGNKRLPPPVESGVKGKLGADLTAGGEFGFGQDVFRDLSKKLSQSNELKPYLQALGYNDVTPMDLQALTWFIEKENWTKNNWTTKAGEGGSFEDELRKFPSQRWQSGFSIQQDMPPTDEAMAVTRRVIENSVRNDDDVMVYRVHPTYGRYDNTNERSFDVELTAKPSWDPSNWMRSVIEEAKGNNQKDVIFSRRLSPAEAEGNLNARPGVEIYFQDRASMEQMIPILEKFTNNGVDGFTFATDLRLRERTAGGRDVPDYVGIRMQFVPEIRARFDDDFRNAVLKDPAALQAALDEALSGMQGAINALDQSGAKIVDARVHHYDTLVVGKESYDQFLNGISNPSNASSVYAESAGSVDPRKRFGQPLISHVEGRDRALRKGDSGGAADAGPAVEQPKPGVDGFAKGGVADKAHEIYMALRELRNVAKQHHIEKPKLAYLIRQMGVSNKDAAAYANNILHESGFDLSQRLKRNPQALSKIKQLTAGMKKMK